MVISFRSFRLPFVVHSYLPIESFFSSNDIHYGYRAYFEKYLELAFPLFTSLSHFYTSLISSLQHTSKACFQVVIATSCLSLVQPLSSDVTRADLIREILPDPNPDQGFYFLFSLLKLVQPELGNLRCAAQHSNCKLSLSACTCLILPLGFAASLRLRPEP